MTRSQTIASLPSLPVDVTPADREAAFWRMSAAERQAAYHRGELTFRECLRWGARAPGEPPCLDGEFEYIAALTPEVAEARA